MEESVIFGKKMKTSAKRNYSNVGRYVVLNLFHLRIFPPPSVTTEQVVELRLRRRGAKEGRRRQRHEKARYKYGETLWLTKGIFFV